MLSSIFLKMLRGGFAPSGYRPSATKNPQRRTVNNAMKQAARDRRGSGYIGKD
jgi:hypothetical protein